MSDRHESLMHSASGPDAVSSPHAPSPEGGGAPGSVADVIAIVIVAAAAGLCAAVFIVLFCLLAAIA